MRTLYIRADANKTIATGHVMRCLALADVLRKLSVETVFITADDDSGALIDARQYRRICLHTKWDDMESELPVLRKVLSDEGVTGLLVDSYMATPKYLKALKKLVRVAYIDDMPMITEPWHIPCDVLVNYSAYSDTFPYRSKYRHTKLLLGCDYAPLRACFFAESGNGFDARKRCDTGGESLKKALIMTGGTDRYGVSLYLADALPGRYPDTHFIFISGSLNTHYDELLKIADHFPNTEVLLNVSDLERYMLQCDLAVTAGGTTLYELAATRTPAVSFSFADNQLRNVEAFDRKGCIPYAGDVRDGMQGRIEELFDEMAASPKRRRQCQNAMCDLIGPGSTMNLARALLKELEI